MTTHDDLLPHNYQIITDIPANTALRSLLDLKNPPKQLFVRGTWDDNLFINCVAVVGSRHITTYGKQVIEKLIPTLALAGVTIISGFMYGCDQYAHQLALEHGAKTIAILGFGITQALEGKEKKLADAIIEAGGLIISEWEDQKPALWTFPLRNRIVVALSNEVFIIEAAEKSGSLITAKLATTLHRKLWAVPGPITSQTSRGTNKLIADGLARCWLGEPIQRTLTQNSIDPIYKLLATEPLSANELARILDQDIASIGAQLSMLQLTGQIMEREHIYYVI